MRKYLLYIAALTAPLGMQAAQAIKLHNGPAQVVSPTIPKTYSLAGTEVDLDRADLYERFDRELTSAAYTHGNTLLTIKRANKYFPVMAPILRRAGVPDDLLYLACVESYLNPRAISGVKAAGIWQFMPATAKQYGLEVSDEVDERYNLVKATEAAAKYLKAARDKYGDWITAMASYNAGQGRISTQLDQQDVDNALDLYLNDETSRYIFRILATKAIMEHPGSFGYELRADQLYYPMDFDEVTVAEPVADWADWAKQHGITYSQLREANPWIRDRKLTNAAGRSYTVLVPKADSTRRSTQHKAVFNPAWVK